MKLLASPSSGLKGAIDLPGDKSVSHRAVMLGALCDGQVKVQNFLDSEDCLHSLKAMQQLGVNIQRDGTNLTIEGVGLHGLIPANNPIDCGNAGTLIRLFAGLMAGQNFDTELFGDDSLSKRPMDRIIEPLSQMGAKIVGQVHDGKTYPPLKITGNPDLKAIDYKMPIASAQVKSSIMLATLFAKGQTVIDEGKASRDHTERMLQGLGNPVEVQGSVIKMSSSSLNPKTILVPGDISSSAFFMVAATLIPGSEITLLNVGLNPTRVGVIHILKEMGADIEVDEKEGIEPIGDIKVRASLLKGIEIPAQWIVSAIDEFPILFIAAAFAKGQTTLTGAQELRVKEVDRIEVMAENLRACGIEVATQEDGISIVGGGFKGAQVYSKGDHRVAMAFAIAGCAAGQPVYIHDSECINTSFPSFVALSQQLGLKIIETR